MRIETSTAASPRRYAAKTVLAPVRLVSRSCAGARGAFAQSEDLPPRDVYHERGRTSGDKIALCVNGGAMMASFEKDLAQQIASRLLLTPNVIEVKTWD